MSASRSELRRCRGGISPWLPGPRGFGARSRLAGARGRSGSVCTPHASCPARRVALWAKPTATRCNPHSQHPINIYTAPPSAVIVWSTHRLDSCEHLARRRADAFQHLAGALPLPIVHAIELLPRRWDIEGREHRGRPARELPARGCC